MCWTVNLLYRNTKRKIKKCVVYKVSDLAILFLFSDVVSLFLSIMSSFRGDSPCQSTVFVLLEYNFVSTIINRRQNSYLFQLNCAKCVTSNTFFIWNSPPRYLTSMLFFHALIFIQYVTNTFHYTKSNSL